MPIYKMDGKKDGRQKYRVRINYVDALGKSKQIDRVAYGADSAKALERQLNHSIKHQTPVKTLSLRGLFDEYIAVKKHEVRETSLYNSNHILEFHVLPTLENIQLDKLSLPALQEWKTYMEHKNLGLASKQNAFTEFRTLLNYAVKMEYIPKNPLTRLGNFKDSTEHKKEMLFYTGEEFQKYIEVARQCALQAEEQGKTKEWGYYVFFCIAFYTGLRKGEINALQWGDIQDGYLSVKRSIAQSLKGEDRETPPKNQSSIRTLQLPLPLLKILEEHYQRCQSLEGFNNTFKVCGGTRALRDTNIRTRNQKYAGLAGLKTIRIHDFRHSHVSLLANEGINIQEIARRLGHAKIEMTWNTYAHLYPREEEKAVAILDSI